MGKNQFGDISIKGDHSAIGIGSDHNITNINQHRTIDDLTTKLLQEVRKTGLSEQQKKDMEDAIDEVAKQVKLDRPNKITLQGILLGVNSIITTVSNSPSLIDAYEKWRTWISTFTG